MTIEQKAKAYDEAIERAESIYNETAIPSATTKGICTYIFPELKESEDERIRKEIISYIKNSIVGVDKQVYGSWLAWLEKQGEHYNFRQKIQVGDQVTRNEDGMLVNLSQLNRVAKKDEKQGKQKTTWSEDDERIYQSIMDDTVQENQLNNKQTNWLRSIKYRYFPQPKQEWGEEDERLLKLSIENLTELKDRFSKEYGRIGDCIEWLKSLKPQK